MRELLIVFLSIICSLQIIADEPERVRPTYGVKFDRPIIMANIEGKLYDDVIVELDAADFNAIFNEGVKITVKDISTGEKIYKKRFSKSYLYAFSDGTIYVGKGNALTQVTLLKYKNDWLLNVREKGIY